MPPTPDAERDVIVKHVTGRDAAGVSSERWVIFLGSDKRGDTEHPQGALVFARLLADLVKRPVWIVHDSEFRPVDSTSIRGCSCC